MVSAARPCWRCIWRKCWHCCCCATRAHKDPRPETFHEGIQVPQGSSLQSVCIACSRDQLGQSHCLFTSLHWRYQHDDCLGAPLPGQTILGHQISQPHELAVCLLVSSSSCCCHYIIRFCSTSALIAMSDLQDRPVWMLWLPLVVDNDSCAIICREGPPGNAPLMSSALLEGPSWNVLAAAWRRGCLRDGCSAACAFCAICFFARCIAGALRAAGRGLIASCSSSEAALSMMIASSPSSPAAAFHVGSEELWR